MNQAVADSRSTPEAVIGSVAAAPLAVGFAALFGLATAAGWAISSGVTLAILACGLSDLIPIAMACVLRSRQSFALAWLAAALLRLPAALLVAMVFQGQPAVTDALPFVYLATLLLSVAIAALILRAHEEAAAR